MVHTSRFRRSVLALTLAAAVPVLGACDDDPVEPIHDDPDAEFLELTIGEQMIRIDADGTITGDPVTIEEGQSVAVTAEFLDADADPIEFDDDFELRATSADNTIVTWGRTGTWTGTLTGVAEGATTIEFQLWHLGEDHEDWEQSLPITVEAAS